MSILKTPMRVKDKAFIIKYMIYSFVHKDSHNQRIVKMPTSSILGGLVFGVQ